MAEVVKAAAKKSTSPKKSAVKKPIEKQVATKTPTHEEIAERAYDFWAERGHQHGHADEDWHRAQQALESA
jgi:hypothetical protein